MSTKYIDKSLQKVQFIFLCSGLTLQSKTLKKRKKLKNRLIYLINFFWLNSDVLGEIFWFIDGIKIGRTLIELTYIAPCITFSAMAILKSIYLIHYEDKISDLIDKLRELEASDEKIDKNRDDIRKNDSNFLHRVLKCSNILNIMLIVTFTASPLIMIAIKFVKTNEIDLILPFLIVYPFDSHDIKYWPFVYAHQIWSASIVLANLCGADYFLYICCTYLRIQFRLLQHDFTHIVKKERYLTDRDLGQFDVEFIKLVKWHQNLIRLSGILELINAKSTLYNFISSSIILCVTGFNVIAIKDAAFAVTFLVFLTASLLQIYLLCSFGDLLMKSSMEVSDAIYNCKWYNLNARSRKNLLIVLTRAQEPCKLTAFGFSDVNLRAFMNILSSSWSYFAVLKTVYNPSRN